MYDISQFVCILCSVFVLTIKPSTNQNNTQFDSLMQLAASFEQSSQYSDALLLYQKAAELEPVNARSIVALYKIGSILVNNQGNVIQSIPYLEKAFSLNQRSEFLLQFLCHQYFKIGRFQDAAAFWKIGWQNCSQEQLNLMLSQNLTGTTILLTNADAGGWGDAFMWLRFAQELHKRGAIVYYDLQQRAALEPLLSLCPYLKGIIKEKEKIPHEAIPIVTGNLMPIFCQSIQSILADIPYLYARQDLIDYYKTYLQHDTNFKIGICWNPQLYRNQNGESIKNLRQMPLMSLYPLSSIRGISIYSLQKIFGTDQLQNIPADFIIHKFNENIDTIHGRFMDTAAIIKNLDLIITIDTSIAHLAGALGASVWIMLPFAADFRWFIDRSDCPWYPTARLFRQTKPDDWNSVIQQIIPALKHEVENWQDRSLQLNIEIPSPLL